MKVSDDGDKVGELLREGYAADVDPGFAGSLLTELQKEMASRRRHVWVKWAAVAAGVVIICGVAAIIYSRHARPSAPYLAKPPDEGVAPLVVRGRAMRWDSPVMQFRVFEVMHGKLDAQTVEVDLSCDLDAMRRRVRDDLGNRATRTLMEAEVSSSAETLFASLLNQGAGTDMVIELSGYSGDPRPIREGRIISWGGVIDLPPRDHVYALEDTIIIVADGAINTARPHSGNLLRDEWGMPR
jgi:hypothetical protein